MTKTTHKPVLFTLQVGKPDYAPTLRTEYGVQVGPVPVTGPGVMTQPQLDAVHALLPRIGYACWNPFQDGEPPRRPGPFVFTWYDKGGRLHTTRIAADGRILKEVTAA